MFTEDGVQHILSVTEEKSQETCGSLPSHRWGERTVKRRLHSQIACTYPGHEEFYSHDMWKTWDQIKKIQTKNKAIRAIVKPERFGRTHFRPHIIIGK